MKQIVCPISKDKVNEQVVRLNAIIGVLLVIAGFAFDSAFYMLFLMSDFFIRAFTPARFSPISFVSHWITNTMRLGDKQIDKAPKIFAARLGFLLLLVLNILFLTGAQAPAMIVGVYLYFLQCWNLPLQYVSDALFTPIWFYLFTNRNRKN